MSYIAPTITVNNVDDYKLTIERLSPFTKRAHIDISDGDFAPIFLLEESNIWWPEDWTVDMHAMVAKPSEHVQALIDLHPNLIIFHAEVEEDLLPILRQIQQAGIKAGVALLRPTVPSTVKSLILASDHVMIFSGNLGYQGGVASLMQVEKVRLIKAINSGAEIGWDGGVTVENAFNLAQGGVDVLNVGSTIAKSSDPLNTYNNLLSEINKHGVI